MFPFSIRRIKTVRQAILVATWLTLCALLAGRLLAADQRPIGTVAADPAQTQSPAPLPTISVAGKCFGPIDYSVIVVDVPDNLIEAYLQQQVQQVLDEINQQMSTYVEDSDISHFNASQSTEFIPCAPETAAVVARSIELSQKTNGAFDATVGPAVELWGFGKIKHRPGEPELPTQSQVAATLKKIGYQNLTVRRTPPAIKKSNPEVQIDLSAIAKGYAVDRVAERLVELKCNKFLVEVGGEVRVSGQRASGAPWQIGVKRPDGSSNRPLVVSVVSQGAMATSGDYENFVRVGKKRYAHTINPVTGQPVEHSLASASVLAGDCMTADALATAAMVLGAKKADRLFRDNGIEFYLVGRTGDFSGRYERFASDAFPFLDENNRQLLIDVELAGRSRPSTTSVVPVFLAAVVVFALVVVGMAVGAIFNNKPVSGSCGGLANMTNEDGETSCGICSKPVTDCIEKDTIATADSPTTVD